MASKPAGASAAKFLIVPGWPRCGTTALHNALADQGRFSCYSQKELHAFTASAPTREEYLARFDTPGSAPGLYLDCSPSYILGGRDVAERIRSALPQDDVKILIAARNPVDRAWSHYHLDIRNELAGLDYLLNDVLGQFAYGRSFISDFAARRYMYTDCADRAAELIEVFGRENVELVDVESLRSDQPATLARLSAWLGEPLPSLIPAANEATGLPRFIYGGAAGLTIDAAGRFWRIAPRQLVLVNDFGGNVFNDFPPQLAWQLLERQAGWTRRLPATLSRLLYDSLFQEDHAALYALFGRTPPEHVARDKLVTVCEPTEALLANLEEASPDVSAMQASTRVGLAARGFGKIEQPHTGFAFGLQAIGVLQTDPDAALTAALEGIRLAPDNPLPHALAADAAFRIGDLETARSAAEAWLRLTPQSRGAIRCVTTAWRLQGGHEAAGELSEEDLSTLRAGLIDLPDPVIKLRLLLEEKASAELDSQGPNRLEQPTQSGAAPQ